MTETFAPKNELERQLLAAQAGEIDSAQFMQILLQSQVFMPILDEHGIAGFAPSDRAQPLTLEDPEGGGTLLPLFTSPERAREFVRNYPGYEGGLLAEFTWILERVGSGVGITLNPDLPAGLEMAPEMVAQLRR